MQKSMRQMREGRVMSGKAHLMSRGYMQIKRREKKGWL
mgnify:CR=1 FL=1